MNFEFLDTSRMNELKLLFVKENIYERDILYAFDFLIGSKELEAYQKKITESYRGYNYTQFILGQYVALIVILFTINEIIIFHEIRKLFKLEFAFTRLSLKSIIEFRNTYTNDKHILKLDRDIPILFQLDHDQRFLLKMNTFLFKGKRNSELRKKMGYDEVLHDDNMIASESWLNQMWQENKDFENYVKEINKNLINNLDQKFNSTINLDDKINNLMKLNKLLAEKTITAEEFDRLKKELKL
jgi:hypothetical protein